MPLSFFLTLWWQVGWLIGQGVEKWSNHAGREDSVVGSSLPPHISLPTPPLLILPCSVYNNHVVQGRNEEDRKGDMSNTQTPPLFSYAMHTMRKDVGRKREEW
ncbi:hypothetical protein SUGI_0244010 [Cryptomeria japonica]|nr:hypothetical protein SUGI_0244010 [Cryptomeria japonica]